MIRSIKKSPSVAILMSTYNGELYLKEQLDSIQNQDYKNWTLYVSDDGSTDQTLRILKSYQALWSKDKLHILKGPRQGFQKNFMSLITSKKIQADFYMLCDQDDVWLPQKITTAITYLETQDQTRPQLYCGRTSYVTKKLKFIQHSDLFSRPRSFNNAIVQSIAGGNTMAYNNALKKISSLFSDVRIISHDWWLYILCELSEGVTYYDGNSYILYRQHERSLIGANTTVLAKIKRLYMLLSGKFIIYNDCHYEAFNTISLKIANPTHINLIDRFYTDRHKDLKTRLRMIRVLKVYRQTRDGMLALYLAALLKRL
jgi:glycosyltransferase involved in cell wall biosynthesis